METAERIQRRIDALDDLHGIARTMKVLSAVSIRQYESASESVKGYFHTVELGLYVALTHPEEALSSNTGADKPQQTAAIVFGSDHGLCGRFNDDIASYSAEQLKHSASPSAPLKVIAVGARLSASLEQLGVPVTESFMLPGSAARITHTVQQLLLKLDEWQSEHGNLDLRIFYNYRPNSIERYQPFFQQVLPVNLNSFEHLREDQKWPSKRLPTYTMDRQALLTELLRQYLFVSIFRACAESQLGEHAARLTTMQSAEKNLEEKLNDVTAQFRRARQDAITTELLDVISGFEAIVADVSDVTRATKDAH